MEPIDIAVALLLRDGHLLVTRRDEPAHLDGLWEFPGGKRKAGEDITSCLKREVLEETGLRVGQVQLFHQTVHRYPDRAVRLHFFLCPVKRGRCPTAGRWVLIEKLVEYRFPEANCDVLAKLANFSGQ